MRVREGTRGDGEVDVRDACYEGHVFFFLSLLDFTFLFMRKRKRGKGERLRVNETEEGKSEAEWDA